MNPPRQKRPPLADLDAVGIAEWYKGEKIRRASWGVGEYLIPDWIEVAVHGCIIRGVNHNGFASWEKGIYTDWQLYRAPKPKKKPGKKVSLWAFQYKVHDSKLIYFEHGTIGDKQHVISLRKLYIKQGYICGPIFKLTGIAPPFPKQKKADA